MIETRLTASLLSSTLALVPSSIILGDGIEYALARDHGELKLVVLAKKGDHRLEAFDGEGSAWGEDTLLCAQKNSKNLAALCQQIAWLNPLPLGLGTSAGMGDRLGVATPGHVRAVRHTLGSVKPVFAQQSMRENARTARSAQQVLEDAVWAVFQEGWREGFGADADHLKTVEDIATCFPLGYSFFTIDPGDFVNNQAERVGLVALRDMIGGLSSEMSIAANGLLNKTVSVEGTRYNFDETTLLRSMAKYGKAVWHVVGMYRYLECLAGGKPFELEVSVDETEQPTTPCEHVYIASELKRLGVKWVSLAPRYVGRFEKGVDYIGDLAAFDADVQAHAAIAQHFGPYKLSLHSGSDKFSIYHSVMLATRGLVHLKTAGTSYLEALRTIAEVDEVLFKEIYTFALERYDEDKVSYHVSAQKERAPGPDSVADWTAVLDQFDAREILHVTFGSVVRAKDEKGELRYFSRLMEILNKHAEVYAGKIEQHFVRHLEPFASRLDLRWKTPASKEDR